ncbi:hypothetical protein B0I35DRAFT_410603 [Stachybotrys elegans]|uniref:Glucose-methanol-choline oxidoreductase N-terminal domain-containing protein n=1 Tax=Stachybotrys elegans TaxID=80388 RepID=A0A8K0SS83_9HYPO|nr:hypothetical protein B0I35DRAFT_410603 [Stachybotrys elegans]
MLWDCIVVGGGLAGSSLSSRLLQYQPEANILIVEAGRNVNNNPDIMYRNGSTPRDLFWNMPTTPQRFLNDRSVTIAVGTALGGGTAVNGANWVRGDRADYDSWADAVGDDSWSYDNLLPYMQRTEHFPHPLRNPGQHGYRGPVAAQTVSSTSRQYPLREQVLESWNNIGFQSLPDLDANSGNPVGVADFCENRANGRRQIASVVYPLDGVTVLTETMVQKVLTTRQGETIRASGVRLANGTELQSRNVVVSAGALRTPQVLMLSGIGPAGVLQEHDIEVVVDAPEVGRSLMDHTIIDTQWRIREPGAGYAPGSGNPLFEEERYGWGYPQDFMVSGTVSRQGLIDNIAVDEGSAPDPETHPLLKHVDRTFLEYVLMYRGGANDGSVVTLQSFLFTMSSRGTVTLGSSNVTDFPVIDPQYCSTATDRYIQRAGLRNLFKFAGSDLTPMGRDILDGEITPEGQQALRADMDDDELNQRLFAGVRSALHPHGTASMGTVVDRNLKVNGVDNLFVVDASVIPVPIAAHIQVAIYALAERAAEILSNRV